MKISIKKFFKTIQGKPKAKKFNSNSEYFAWYYRMRPIWEKGWKRHIKNVQKSRSDGYIFRMNEIKRRKSLTLEQRQKEKAKRREASFKAREIGRKRRLEIAKTFSV